MFAKFSVYDIIYLLVSILVLVLIFIFWWLDALLN
jgi:hypothetical protein